MHAKLLFFLVLNFLFFHSSCQTKRYTPSDFTGDMIIFGSGGGFAGTVTEYCLLENGQLFLKKPGESSFAPLDDIDINLARQTFQNYKTLDLASIKLRVPGNMYYFVRKGTKDKMHEITWGAHDASPPDKVKTYYSHLNNLVNPQVNQ